MRLGIKKSLAALLLTPMTLVNASQLSEARDTWHMCIAARIAALDDGISTASDIAFATQGDCAEEHTAMLKAMTLSPEMRYKFESGRREATVEVARIIVVKLRAEKKAKPN